nr:hypothetical protein [Tanacetum cinerariifolium]
MVVVLWRGVWWWVFGSSVVFSGDGVGNGVRRVVCGVACGVVCGVGLSWSHGAEGKDSFVKCDMTGNDDFVGVQVKAPISMMIVRVPEKDRWCGVVRGASLCGGKLGGREDIEHDTRVECFVYYKTQGHVTTGFELHCHWGDQDIDAKGNDYYETIGIKINGAFIIISGGRGEELVMRENEGEDYEKIKNLALITMKDNRN